MASNRNTDEYNLTIVTEFTNLLEKSKQLFNGLRDLPQCGHKQWQSYFGRTFDVYTKLWKFQQQHRQILDSIYSLKRWQIGEIASKIGQLYYHYYLRTSETNYLFESYSFYSAIRMRGYYSNANKEERSELLLKKMRYYARFIVVCLLLKRMNLVRDLVRELNKQVEDYKEIYNPDDAEEWQIIVKDLKEFIEADSLINIQSQNSAPIVVKHRLSPNNIPPIDKSLSSVPQIQLVEVIIVGHCYDQVVFSELTLDMFRILQSFEREPQDELTNSNQYSSSIGMSGRQGSGSSVENGPMGGYNTPMSGLPGMSVNNDCSNIGVNNNNSQRRNNPHKYLLYRPTLPEFNSYLATCMKELPLNGGILIYLSCDGLKSTPSKNDVEGYELGGVITSGNREYSTGKSKKRQVKEMCCIHPGDLYIYTRKPLFIIVDSNNSTAFQNFSNLFDQPLVCLMSPEQVPNYIQKLKHKGNLFTLFIHCPITAFCVICNVSQLSTKAWDRAHVYLDQFMIESGKILLRCKNLDYSYLQFYSDDFLRILILRYCFCFLVLKMHQDFQGPKFYPVSYPQLPELDLYNHSSLQKKIYEIAALMDCWHQFSSDLHFRE